MESFIVQEITVNNEILDLEGLISDTIITFYNDYSKFKYNLEGSKLNLINFIESNEICIQEDCIFTLGIDRKDSLSNLFVDFTNENCIIYKNIEIKTNKYTYMINLLSGEDNELQIHIKRLTPNNADIKIHNLHIHNKKLTFTVEKIGTRFIDEIGIVLTNNKGHIQGITCVDSRGNKANFQINLEELSAFENTNYATNLVLDEQILPLKFNHSFNLNNCIFEGEHSPRILTVSVNKHNNLVIKNTNNLTINPKISSIIHNDHNLIISGKISSSASYYSKNDYKTVFKLLSNDGSKSIQDDIQIHNGSFTYEISDKELLDIKDTCSNIWSAYIEVHRDNKEVASSKIKCNLDFKPISETIYDDEFAAALAVDIDNENNLTLKVKGDLTIEQILSIKKSGKNIIVKYRTVERVDKLIDANNLKTNILVDSDLFKCKKIVSKGKKTYQCEYKMKDANRTLDLILEKGLTLISETQGIKIAQTMAEINEMVVYRNTLQWIQNTKKYKNITTQAYRKVFLKLPVNNKKVIFESFLGRNVSGNPKYIYEYMRKQGLDSQYSLIWVLNDLSEEIPGNHKKVKRKSLKYYYHMATSGYWIFNVRQGDEIVKRPETKYLQCWHGSPLKRLASDMTNVDMGGNTDLNAYKLNFFKNTRRWDYLLTQNDYSEEIFRRAFNFDKRIIPGYPANDILYTHNNKKEINTIKNKLGIPTNKKVIMYAPTWREDNFYKKGHYKLELELELDKMQEALGDKYIVILRAHYLIANSINISKYEGFVYDFSKGYDIQELYLATDVLVTDYSSVMFDFANLKRPTILFMYDLEKYRDSLRGFYFNIEETAPGPIVKTTEGVINSIKNIEEVKEEYKERQENFYNKFCHIDNGQSAKVAVDTLFFGK